MELTFLGTGTSQGVPVIGCKCDVCTSGNKFDKRLRTSVLIEIDNLKFTIDVGPDFRYQMLRENVEHLDAILITHAHRDHTSGLDDVRAYNHMQNKAMPIYGQSIALEEIRREYFYAFDENPYPGVPELKLVPIENKEFMLEGVKIIPIEVLHHKLPVFGYRINDLTYITDCKAISDKELDKVIGSKVLIINGLKKTEHISHLNLEESLKVIDKIKAERTYITHISHELGLHEVVLKELPENVFLAYDGLKIKV